MPYIQNTIPEGLTAQRLKVARGTYDFAADGGAVGTIPLMGAIDVPAGATILGGWLEVVTPPASGGAATVAVQVNAANDIVADTAITLAPWSTAGSKSVVPVFTGETVVRTTAARDISAVIATAALTAGKFDIVLVYIDPLA